MESKLNQILGRAVITQVEYQEDQNSLPGILMVDEELSDSPSNTYQQEEDNPPDDDTLEQQSAGSSSRMEIPQPDQLSCKDLVNFECPTAVPIAGDCSRYPALTAIIHNVAHDRLTRRQVHV